MRWEEASPLGNGRLGAMVFGIPDRERIQLNEDSVWSGGFRNRNNPAAKEALGRIRELLSEGRAVEAEELALECFSGLPPTQRVYQTAGELQISFSPDCIFGHQWSGTGGGELLKDIKNLRQELDIDRAIHSLSFEYRGVVFKRECFISAVSDILALRFTASSPDGKPVRGKISFRAGPDRGVFYDRRGNIEDSAFIACDSGIPFCVMITVKQKGGTQESRGGFITALNADEAVFFLDIRTGFKHKDYISACLSSLKKCAEKDWKELLQEHAAEYRSLYGRTELKITGKDNIEKYFNFCRYLLISCSRPGTNPANLQGLWNPHMDPPWGCDFTININTQMNYWPSCMCNLAETEEPLFDLIERMYPNGKITAQTMYGCRGFTAHHNTDIWGDTSPRDYWLPGTYWVLGAAWLSLHIWEHYEYTQDSSFLKKYFYLIKDACLFFADYLIPDEKNKNLLIVSPSVSPENSYVLNGGTVSLCTGCEMDSQILRKLFSSALLAAEILTEKDSDTERFRSILERLGEPSIHSNGTLREWREEYEEAEPGHRHFSHLFALWPGDAITPDETPELALAARKSIEKRLGADGGHTGWSRAWLINFMARLFDGEAALENLNALLNDFTLPNLFNNGPPFQIDGNFGALAGITQMLVQSRSRYANGKDFHVEIDLLPALPRNWPSGSLKGVCAKGNLKLDIEWREGKPSSIEIANMGEKEIHVVTRFANEKINFNLTGTRKIL
jgi:alpha-L-fucosidase 2